MVVGSMLVLLVAGTAVQAQALAQRPIMAPGHGLPYGAPVVVSPYGQPVPVYVQPAGSSTGVPASTAQITRSQNGQTKPAFRITTVGEEVPKPPSIEPETAEVDGWDEDASYKSDDCGGKGCGSCCACNPYAVRVYAELLYLRARDSEVCYAVETNSNLPTTGAPSASIPIQTAPIGVLDQDYSAGFRAGFGVCLDACSEIGASYTWFDTSTEDSISTDVPYKITALPLHPATEYAARDSLQAAGRHDLQFDLIDIDYRSYLVQTCTSSLDYVIGVRYGNLEQAFAARYTDDLSQASNRSEVATDIDFDGAGLRLGLEAERFYCAVPVKLYMKGFTSLMAGEFDATYQQTVQNNSGYGVDTGWKAGRIVPTFDFELGGGIYLPGGRLQATVGYVFSAWTNVVKTEDWIHAVQANDFRDLGDTITFDGLVARVEGRF
jgi:hypothetical protein